MCVVYLHDPVNHTISSIPQSMSHCWPGKIRYKIQILPSQISVKDLLIKTFELK